MFFDNLQVTHIRGPILEETHYYPGGLTMAGISSKAAGGIENKKKYNGIELENDLEIRTYDAFFRELDPQTVRWWQIDPVTEGYEHISPYASNYNNPIRYSDPLGNEGEDCCWEEIKQFTKDAITVVAGVGNAWATNQAGGIGRSDASAVGFNKREASLFKAGQTAGDLLTLGTAALEVVVGGGGELASLGIATPIAVPLALHGATVAGPTAFRNLISGDANSSGSSNNVKPATNTQTAKPSKVEKSSKVEQVGNFTRKTKIEPSKKSPGQSRAEYTTYKNKDGKTIKTYKDSYDRGNKFRGRKALRGGPEGRPAE